MLIAMTILKELHLLVDLKIQVLAKIQEMKEYKVIQLQKLS